MKSIISFKTIGENKFQRCEITKKKLVYFNQVYFNLFKFISIIRKNHFTYFVVKLYEALTNFFAFFHEGSAREQLSPTTENKATKVPKFAAPK